MSRRKWTSTRGVLFAEFLLAFLFIRYDILGLHGGVRFLSVSQQFSITKAYPEDPMTSICPMVIVGGIRINNEGDYGCKEFLV